MRAVGLILLLLTAGPALAQDRVRLDEFAPPPTVPTIGIDQLPAAAPVVVEQVPDRSVAIPELPEALPAPIDQLPTTDESLAQQQLTGPETSRRVAPWAVSSAADSKPGAAQRIGGRDRCDPQALHGAEQVECLRILELRATEFPAAEAPVMSAEERIVAAQDAREREMLASPGLRVRFAGEDDPNAELPANQEIASLYFERDAGANPSAPNGVEAQPSIPPGDVMEALQSALPGFIQP